MTKLLIVDDEKIIRQTIHDHIPWESLGIQVIGMAQNGIEAYDIILDEYPDIVITDIKMPGLSGLELLQRIKKINKDVEFIILSGYGEFDYAREAMQWGVRHYLLKPCNEEQIIESLREVMRDIAQKRAFQDNANHRQSLRQLDGPMMLNLINDGVAYEADMTAPDYSAVYSPYRKFLDFDKEAYELCYFYFVDEGALPELLDVIHTYRTKHTPGIGFYTLYVHQTLLFFFRSYHYEYEELDRHMSGIRLKQQQISCEYKRVEYPCLSQLLDTVIQKVKRYETIYYNNSGSLVSLCNYRSIIRDVERLTASIYETDMESAGKAFRNLLDLLSQITDPVFLKQLVSSIIMLSASRSLNYTALEATEFLLVVNGFSDEIQIMENLTCQLSRIFEDYHAAGHSYGTLSKKIDEYVQNNLADTNLSLKWIAEDYLYMNVDYVSKRFFKETGRKFSNYLTDLRIQKAKELLADSDCDRIQSVAEMVGCGNNPQYFSHLFKKATGMTPSGYIKYISGGKQNDKNKGRAADQD